MIDTAVMAWLPPLPVALPLAAAAILLFGNHILKGRIPDVIAIIVALLVLLMAVALFAGTRTAPATYWFGGWKPQGHVVIGIAFVIDQSGAALTGFIALLFALTFVFAWGFFEEVGTQFHVLMLVFMAALAGFTLTHDLFNMFVWFEVMSVAAFALTAYALTASPLEGALNFTITNSLGSFMMLGGIGLLYARVSALDFDALRRGVAAAPHDALIAAAFCLLATALLIKGAIVPFHFWLSDAHAVAPSPVSVIFSGIMVPIALYGLAKIAWTIFGNAPQVLHVVHGLLLPLGGATALIGGIGCLLQRHIKRLLAFSTIAHMGIVLTGLAVLTPMGLAGLLGYVLGHGLVKGALFMVAGICLASLGGIDEIGLRGQGRPYPVVGAATVLGGLLLAGLPLGVLDHGEELIDASVRGAGAFWISAASSLGAAFTGAAVLRVAGRVFFGLGPVPGEEEKRAPTEAEKERANRPVWLMLAPAAFMLLLAIAAGPAAKVLVTQMAHGMLLSAHAAGAHGPHAEESTLAPWLSTGFAVLLATFELQRHRILRLARIIEYATAPVARAITAVHTGLIGDYVTWIVIGLALIAWAFVFA